jgi:hypothetical protein
LVVEPFVLAMLDPRHDLLLRRAVGAQLVGHHDTRRPTLLLQELAQQPLGRLLVASALDQGLEHKAVLIDRAPQVVLLARDRHDHLVEVPLVAALWPASADPVGDLAAKLQAPLRTVSWLTSMPRTASISSTIRRLKGKRK